MPISRYTIIKLFSKEENNGQDGARSGSKLSASCHPAR